MMLAKNKYHTQKTNTKNLTNLIEDLTRITTRYIRKHIATTDYGGLTPLIEHAITSTVPGSDRALMVKLGYELTGKKNIEIALPGMAAIEVLNIDLLVTDDFFDNRSTKRMGKKTVRQIWGDEYCITLGFVLKSLSNELLIDAWTKSSPWSLHDAVEVIESASKWQYYSQIQEVELINKPLSKINLNMYLDLIKNATSSGIAGSFELGCVFGGGNKNDRLLFKAFGFQLGHLLQIRDDLIDYIYDENLIRKGAFNDLFTKKRRLPLLVAYWEGTKLERNQIDGILMNNDISLEDALFVTELITSHKVESKIKKISASISSKCREGLKKLPDIQTTKTTLSQLIELFTDL